MEINNIVIKNEGYICCKSNFYSAQDILTNCSCYSFSIGINKLTGDIDSGNWAVSYLLSMYNHRPKDFVLFEPPQVKVNGKCISLNALSELSCYMDVLDPLFSNISVKKQIINGLNYSKINYSYVDIRNIFHLDDERFNRPIKGVGNEIFKSMAAIAFSYKKEIFCFPWMSVKRFESYHDNLTDLLKTLEALGKIVILPVGLSPLQIQ